MILRALNFFATGSYQSPVGNSRYVNISQSSVYRRINDVVNALNHPDSLNTWFKFPQNMNEIIKVRNGFVTFKFEEVTIYIHRF